MLYYILSEYFYTKFSFFGVSIMLCRYEGQAQKSLDHVIMSNEFWVRVRRLGLRGSVPIKLDLWRHYDSNQCIVTFIMEIRSLLGPTVVRVVM